MKKIIIGIFVIGLLVIIGCNSSQESDIENTGDITQDDTITDTGDVKEFSLIAKEWEFVPNTITVNKGDRVILNIQNVDVAHGFALTEFNVNEDLEPRKTTKIEFVADKEGTFPFFCSVFCGDGHSAMKGRLIVN